MPAVNSFAALGVGNGFPFCPAKEDISAYDLWSTIDGYNKSNTSPRIAAGIAESKRLAMLYIWNTYQLIGSVTVSSETISDPNSEDNANTPTGDPLNPRSRVCLAYNEGFSDFGELYSSTSYLMAFLDLYVHLRVTAMYNGSTSDESNFIGYGIGDADGIGIWGNAEDAELGDWASVGFNCVGSASEVNPPFERDSQYTSLSMGSETFYGVGVAEADSPNSLTAPTINGGALSVTSAFELFDGQIFIGQEPVNISLTSLNTYTYN